MLLVVASTIAMADDRVAVEHSSRFWSAMHDIPFNRSAFRAPSLGAQLSGVGTDFAVTPHVPAKLALTYRYTTLEYETSSTGADEDVSILSVASAVLFRLGYAMTW